MPLVKTFDLQDFTKEFRDYGRKQDFSDQALEIIFEQLNDSEENIEIDVISICCEYTEQSCTDILECNSEWIDTNDDMDNEELVDAAREYLNDNSFIVGEYMNDAGETVFIFGSF